jgi:hypothetical protein
VLGQQEKSGGDASKQGGAATYAAAARALTPSAARSTPHGDAPHRGRAGRRPGPDHEPAGGLAHEARIRSNARDHSPHRDALASSDPHKPVGAPARPVAPVAYGEGRLPRSWLVAACCRGAGCWARDAV